MNLILLESAATEYRLSVGDKRFEHARGVLRLGVGDTFAVGLRNGPLGRAKVTHLDTAQFIFSVEWGERPILPPPVSLLLGMCRPAAARRILQTLPTLGVRRLIMAGGGRSDPAYARSSLWRGGEWCRLLEEGAEQACDTYIPEVVVLDTMEEAVEHLDDVATRIVLDVYATGGWAEASIEREAPACLAVGSERGWTAHERALLASADFIPVSLFGGRVMRCEAAVTVGLALLADKCGWITREPQWTAPALRAED